MRARGFTKAFGQSDPRFGIMHIVGPETGLSQPGMVLCAGDSHTCTHGAMGLISWGGESSDNILRTGTVIRRRPRTMRVNIVGTLGPGIRAKDVILRTIARLGTDSGTGYAVEYAGPVVRALSQEARFSICNLAVEMASPTGMVSPDDTTYEYLAGREFAPSPRYWDQAVAFWRTLPTDDDAVFDREETIDMTGVEPQVTWGINPEHAIGISERIPDPDRAPANKRATYRAGDRVQPPHAGRAHPGDADRRSVHRLLCREPDQRSARGGGHRRRPPGGIHHHLGLGRSGVERGQGPGRGGRPGPHLPGRGFRMA